MIIGDYLGLKAGLVLFIKSKAWRKFEGTQGSFSITKSPICHYRVRGLKKAPFFMLHYYSLVIPEECQMDFSALELTQI